MTYAQKLKDPRWQKRRLELLKAADWTCNECGSKTETLHVHHGYYKRATAPWDYPDDVMHVLCEPCHGFMQMCMEDAHRTLATINRFGLLAVSELVASIKGTERGLNAVDLLTTVLHSTNGEGPNGSLDFEWLVKATLSAAQDQAAERALLIAKEGIAP